MIPPGAFVPLSELFIAYQFTSRNRACWLNTGGRRFLVRGMHGARCIDLPAYVQSQLARAILYASPNLGPWQVNREACRR